MIYYCADDYGLCDDANVHIRQCLENGALNKVSVFPNIEPIDLCKISRNSGTRLSLHLNLVEGKCLANAGDVTLLASKDGFFKHRFGGLFLLNLFYGKKIEEQLYREIKAQVLFWKSVLPEDVPFCIDSHQHTHMIPAVFRALIRVLKDENINVEYMRIPAEPLMPYLKSPSLFFTYNPTNIIKQWLLKFLWLCNKKHTKNFKINTAYFCGIMFSGKMDTKRVKKVLPHYTKLADKHRKDIEVLFHPGYTDTFKYNLTEKNIVFKDFYLSENRKTEFDSIMNITERSVQ